MMRDIPLFTTGYGAASLTLSQIPYRGEAYIRLQDTLEPEKLLEECISFCRFAGAEHIYASGHLWLERYPLYTAVWQMRAVRDSLPGSSASLFPVQEHTLEKWRSIYNEAMASVSNASYMTVSEGKKLLARGDGYFIHRGGVLLGVGTASGDTIGAVASVVPGAGSDIVGALCHALSAETVMLEVASDNHRAIALYSRLGFIRSATVAVWYQIL